MNLLRESCRYLIILFTIFCANCTHISTDAELKGRQISSEHGIHVPMQLNELENLPPPVKKTSISVYDFPDLTGAYKPNDTFAVYSKAVTQGADTIVVGALRAAGLGKWFRVLERKGINAIKHERALVAEALEDKIQRNDLAIRAMQAMIQKQKHQQQTQVLSTENPINVNPSNRMVLEGRLMQQNPPQNLSNKNITTSTVQIKKSPSGDTTVSFPKRMTKLSPSQYILHGGIISYDSDIISAGAGLRFLNVGAFGEMRKDIVTINMRLVDVMSGEIVLSTTVTKGIYSRKLQGSGINYVAIDRILEAEAGISYNEPVFEALNITIQAAVLDLIEQGLKKNIWTLKKVKNRPSSFISQISKSQKNKLQTPKMSRSTSSLPQRNTMEPII